MFPGKSRSYVIILFLRDLNKLVIPRVIRTHGQISTKAGYASDNNIEYEVPIDLKERHIASKMKSIRNAHFGDASDSSTPAWYVEIYTNATLTREFVRDIMKMPMIVFAFEPPDYNWNSSKGHSVRIRLRKRD